MKSATLLEELEALGKASYKRILVENHAIREPCFGVPISELKKIQKRVGVDHALALELYATGNYDAMYLAGLIADDAKMSKKDLQRWADGAYARAIYGAPVPWVAAGSPHGREMALLWIDSPKPNVAAAGWATLASLVAVTADDALDLAELRRLLDRVGHSIHEAPDAVRPSMNGFLVALGSHVAALTPSVMEAAKKIGQVTADLGKNGCKIPSVAESINKVKLRGALGRKRASAKC